MSVDVIDMLLIAVTVVNDGKVVVFQVVHDDCGDAVAVRDVTNDVEELAL